MSNNPIDQYVKAISEQAAREKGELFEAVDHNKEAKKAFNDLKKDGGEHHVGKHHVAANMGDAAYHAAHYGEHHVTADLSHEDNYHEDNGAPIRKHVHAEVVKQNPHVPSDVHKKFTDDIVKWHKVSGE